jgi:CheY-like chemotaxis protein
MGHRRTETGARNLLLGSAVEKERRILIVDDDRDSTHLLKILLEKTGGYLVLEENDAAKAHQSAHNFRPDLILLDIMMRQRDGVDIASEIGADPQLQRTPIIFLTALVPRSDARAGLRIQGHPVLAKPINLPELINRLEENLPAP